MHDSVETRLRALARRAGMAGAPTAVVAAGLALAAVAVAAAAWRWWPSSAGSGGLAPRGQVAASRTGSTSTASTGAAAPTRPQTGAAAGRSDDESPTAMVCVDVVGAVRRPGVYVLTAGARVDAAVQVAGGTTGDAATDAVNLAAKLQDGEHVVIPTKKQVASGTAASPVAAGARGGAAVAGSIPAKVDLNAADAALLDTLPGVGPSTAAKIVADRQQNGPFKTVDDLGRVPGIGPKKLDALKDLVVVR